MHSLFATTSGKTLFKAFLGLLFSATLTNLAIGWSSAPPPNRTGAPPESTTCSLCHGGSGTGSVDLIIGENDGLYIPGESYPVEVRIEESGQERFGFEMTSRLDSSRSNATGSWTPGVANGVNGDEIGHRSAPFASNAYTFRMTWTAPSQDVGAVRFYLAANAANGNFSNDSGDHIYTRQVVLQPAAVFESFWVQSPQTNGWRDTGAAYPEVVGLGFLYDTEWPWCFTHSIGKGSWIHIYPDEGNEEEFWAYVSLGGYFIRGFASVGWYYSLEPGAEGWYRFDF